MAELTGNLVTILNVDSTVVAVNNRRIQGMILQPAPVIQRLTAYLVTDPLSNAVNNNLVAAQTIDFTIERNIRTTAAVSQAIALTFQRGRSLVTPLPVVQSLDGYLIKGDGSLWIDPAIVAYNAGLTPPGQVTFSCSGSTLVLRKPIFGDTQSYEQWRIQRKTLGGDLQIFYDTMWPNSEVLSMEWEWMSVAQAASLLTFLKLSLGEIVTFIDHFGRTWSGLIITPSENVMQPKVAGFSAKLEYQRISS